MPSGIVACPILHSTTIPTKVVFLSCDKVELFVHFTPYPLEEIQNGKGLADEDNLIYIAGKSKRVPDKKISTLTASGFNVKYETVSPAVNDCSMSNYVVLGKRSMRYYNIEAQHGQTAIQKHMVDLLMRKIAK